jgi:DNA-binding phage protein
MRVLEPKQIVQLLQAEVEKAGSQEAWAKKAGLQRTVVNKVLHRQRPPTKSIILALGLRIVVVSD